MNNEKKYAREVLKIRRRSPEIDSEDERLIVESTFDVAIPDWKWAIVKNMVRDLENFGTFAPFY